jgi:hypothetical protein
MFAGVDLLFDEPKRVAFLAKAALIRLFVPEGAVGVYMLLNNKIPFYVGRSDTCSRTRLLSHPLLTAATHIAWEPCRDQLQAFRMEAAWFHAFEPSKLLNQIHPARPSGNFENCPFCDAGDCLAWMHAMQPNQVKGDTPTVTVDPLAAAAKKYGARK